MTLRGDPVEVVATLPDGRVATVRVGVADDSYVARRERETVTLELHERAHPLAAVTTLLDVEDDGGARRVARELARRLEAGELEPTAGAVERLLEQAGGV